MTYVLAALALSTLGLGVWVLSLMADLYLAYETIRAKDKIIQDQKVYIEINLGVLHDQQVAIRDAERVTVELDRIRKELQFGRGMRVEIPEDGLDND
jgi:hypothetical protein